MTEGNHMIPKTIDDLEKLAVEKFTYANPALGSDSCRNKNDNDLCFEGECVGGMKDIVLCSGGQCSQGYRVRCDVDLRNFRHDR